MNLANVTQSTGSVPLAMIFVGLIVWALVLIWCHGDYPRR